MKLLETIKIKNGIPQNLDYHNERMNRSRNEQFCLLEEVYLEDFINVPQEYLKGIVKCRVVYAEQMEQIEFEKYEAKAHPSFFLVNSSIEYAHKFQDRNLINQLKSKFSASSEIIVIRNGFVTDSSYSNLVFKDKNGDWYTPTTYLLKGTQREFLLDQQLIRDKQIKANDLKNYTHFMMVNALLGFDENRTIPIQKIENLESFCSQL